jgi:hypothetical protein
LVKRRRTAAPEAPATSEPTPTVDATAPAEA